MNYTSITLILLGFIGIILHCLVELNKLNKANKGNDVSMTIKSYFKIEVFSLLISLFVVIGCTFIASEVETILAKFGYEWLVGLAYICVGYSAQSVLIFVMGKASKTIQNQEKQ